MELSVLSTKRRVKAGTMSTREGGQTSAWWATLAGELTTLPPATGCYRCYQLVQRYIYILFIYYQGVSKPVTPVTLVTTHLQPAVPAAGDRAGA